MVFSFISSLAVSPFRVNLVRSFCKCISPNSARGNKIYDAKEHTNTVTMGIPSMSNKSRQEASFDTRVAAAELAKTRGFTQSVSNGEEISFRNPETGLPSLIASFTKGLPHDDTGAVIDPQDFFAFVRACNSGDEEEIAAQRLGPAAGLGPDGLPCWRSKLANKLKLDVRGWENQSAGLNFDLEGPDAQSTAMPPAPLLTGAEATSEIAEVYLMALARDIPFSAFNSPEYDEFFSFAIHELNKLDWFKGEAAVTDTAVEIRRRRGLVTRENIFRGILPGSEVGPYLSQFIIAGSAQLGDATVGIKTLKGPNTEDEFEGTIAYGSLSISQKVRIAEPCRDFMTNMDVFLDVQDGADFRGFETYEKGARLITTVRDLATWVHFDALYEGYLNACLILLANRVPFDPNLPFQRKNSIDKQDPFVVFGAAHILSLVCEVATRALKAVRYQKFNIHRRLRPEAAGGLINANRTMGAFPELNELVSNLKPILDRVAKANEKQNRADGHHCPKESVLLPMAFAEGSPFHPSYGSGHAVVAGACVTTLKAFFDSGHVIDRVFQVNAKTCRLETADCAEKLTVGSELNKLADNISIGRDIAGVHWFSDQFESLLLGEEIAIGILQEQKLTYGENFFFSLDKFDGTTIAI